MEHWKQAQPPQSFNQANTYNQPSNDYQEYAPYNPYDNDTRNQALEDPAHHTNLHHAHEPQSNPDSPYEDPYAGTGTAYPQYPSEPRPLPPVHNDSYDDQHEREPEYHDDATPAGFQSNPPHLGDVPSQANLVDAAVRAPIPSEKAVGPTFRPARSGGTVRTWRHDEHSKLWTKGGGVRTCGRFCCCTTFTAIFLILSVILTLVLWVRPPDVTFNGIATNNKNPAVFSADSLTVDIGANIAVANPNYFSVNFDQIKAQAFHPALPNIPLGSGQVTGIDFLSGHETSFTFPFEIKYIFSNDPGYTVLKDIADKCGLMGSPRSKLPLNYKFTVKIKGVVFPITVAGSTSIDCPLTDDQLKTLGGFSGIFGNGAGGNTPPTST